MRKIYLTMVAAMLSVATFAQTPARVEAQSAPLGLRTSKGMKAFDMKKATKKMPFVQHSGKSAAGALKVAKADELPTELISEQPEGTLLKNLNRYGYGYMVYWGYVWLTEMDGYICDVVNADDDKTVYIKDPFSTIATDTWLKCTKGEGDTLVAELPQLIYSEDYEGEVYNYYAYKMTYDSELDWYVADSISQSFKFVMRNDSIIKVDEDMLGLADETGEWVGYGDEQAIISKVTATAYAPSASAEKKQCVMKYKELGTEALEDGTPVLVNVAVEGSDIYIGGLDQDDASLWAKGTLNGNKAVFTKGTYLGVDTVNLAHMYLMPATSSMYYDEDYESYEWSTDFADQIEFDYDATTGTLSSTGHMIANQGSSSLFERAYYAEPNITPWTETAGTPQLPVFSTYNAYDADYGYGNIAFYIDACATDGNFMNPEKVYYNMYFDDELFTFYPDEYAYVTEEMTNVPLNFADNYDIYLTGTLHNVYFYSTGFSKIGVQVTYTGGGETHQSDIAWFDAAGISQTMISGNDAVKGVSYFDLSGRKVSTPANGVFIKSMKLADGSVKNVKVIK